MVNRPAKNGGADGVAMRPPQEAPGAGDSSGGVRTKLAATLVAASAAVLALLPILLLRGAAPGPGPDEPPWPLPELSGATVTGNIWSSEELAGRAAVLIYVDYQCPYCKVELERWERLEVARAGSGNPLAISLWIIASPRSPREDLHWLPESFHTRTVWDTASAVGPALDVSAVPTSYWIDAEGTVRIVRVGQTRPEQLEQNLLALLGPQRDRNPQETSTDQGVPQRR